jgi:hypothetical protein
MNPSYVIATAILKLALEFAVSKDDIIAHEIKQFKEGTK